jgi:hypothetical protein
MRVGEYVRVVTARSLAGASRGPVPGLWATAATAWAQLIATAVRGGRMEPDGGGAIQRRYRLAPSSSQGTVRTVPE